MCNPYKFNHLSFFNLVPDFSPELSRPEPDADEDEEAHERVEDLERRVEGGQLHSGERDVGNRGPRPAESEDENLEIKQDHLKRLV